MSTFHPASLRSLTLTIVVGACGLASCRSPQSLQLTRLSDRQDDFTSTNTTLPLGLERASPCLECLHHTIGMILSIVAINIGYFELADLVSTIQSTVYERSLCRVL